MTSTSTPRGPRGQQRDALSNDIELDAWFAKNGIWAGEESEVLALCRRLAAQRGFNPQADARGRRVEGSLREFAEAWNREPTDEHLCALLVWPRSR